MLQGELFGYAEVKVKLTNEDVVVTPILLWNVTALRPSHCTHHNAAQSIHNHRPLYLGHGTLRCDLPTISKTHRSSIGVRTNFFPGD